MVLRTFLPIAFQIIIYSVKDSMKSKMLAVNGILREKKHLRQAVLAIKSLISNIEN